MIPTKPKSKIVLGKIPSAAGHRILLYGPGGIGKTTLATLAPGPVAFIDADESLPILAPKLERKPMLANVSNLKTLREALQSEWDGVKTIVLDSVTKVEEWAVAYTLETIKIGKATARSVEEYGYGKGLGFVFDSFLPVLADLDRLVKTGINVILIAHDCTTPVPNPSGDDWIRYEPRLQSPSSGKNSIRLRVKEWTDHTLFMGYDVAVKGGKAQMPESGTQSKTIWTCEMPHCMAKSRTTQDQIPVDGRDVWGEILK